MYLFVYGTLKRTYCRHFAIADEVFVRTAQTAPRYRMFNVGTYPGLVEDHEYGQAILGEVWDVKEESLPRLDDVEGVDEGQYIRKPIDVDGFLPGTVQAYFYLWSTEGCPDCGSSWEIR